MSIRAEYTHTCTYSQLFGKFLIEVYHQPIGIRPPVKVASKCVKLRSSVDGAVESIIRNHMAAVTRSLGLGSRERVTEEEDEEQDRLAHKADHDNQCEKDLE